MASQHITTLALAYSAQGEYIEAIRVCEDSMLLMEQLMFVNGAQKSVAVTVKSKAVTTANNKSPGGPAGNGTKASGVGETSYEMAQCICDVCTLWLELSVNEVLYCIRTAGVKELRAPLMELYANLVDRSGATCF